MMEKRCTDIIQVPEQCEQAAPKFVIPNLNLIIIASRDEQWLLLMEVNATHWTIMFIKFVN